MKEKQEHPKGTLVVMLVFMATIIVLWSWVYLTMLERGATP